MGQYFKAYSPARKSVADMTYKGNHGLPHLRNVPSYSPENISQMFDDIEDKMNAEFGEYVLVGDYGTLVYRSGDEQNPSFEIENDTKGFTDIVWGDGEPC